MNFDNSLALILQRLDEIERKPDRMLEELRTPAAIGYSVRRGSLPRKECRILNQSCALGRSKYFCNNICQKRTHALQQK
jgi:hypothetical protein